MAKRLPPPSYYAILNHWNSGGCLETSDGGLWNPLTDIGEPSCQCCGTYNGEWDVGKFQTYSDDDDEKTLKSKRKKDQSLINKRWGLSGFAKCHIVPHRLGGKNAPSNYLIFCNHCHYDFDREVFIEKHGDDLTPIADWVIDYRKDLYEVKNKAVQDVCDEFDFNEAQKKELNVKIIQNIDRYQKPMIIEKKTAKEFGLKVIYSDWYNMARSIAYGVGDGVEDFWEELSLKS
jgi:hypothetical protein